MSADADRHARFYLGVARQECVGLMTANERPHLDLTARIEDNLRVALQRLLLIDPPAVLEISASLLPFWWIRGRLREGLDWLEQALAVAPDAAPELQAAAHFAHGFLIAHDTDDWFAAARSIDVGIALLAPLAEPPPILGMLVCLRAECDVFNGDAASAVIQTEAGLELVRRHPGVRNGWPEIFCLWNVANAKRAFGDADAAVAVMNECAAMCDRVGCRVAEMCACNVLGEIWEERGVLDVSRAFWERALRCRQEIDAVNVGYVHGSMPLNLLAIARVAAKH